jgi:hypothetical protein
MNLHYYNRYIKFIESNRLDEYDEGEFHHIVPRCIGGTDEKNNLVKLGYRQHYIAHYMLAKSFNDDKLWFAFNMMKRVCDGKSVLYEAARKFIRNAISASNTGRKHTDAAKNLMSKQRKGLVVVKDKDGNICRVSVDDPRYISGELVYYRTGLKHKKETLQKMKERSIKGKIICHNAETGEWMYIGKDEEIPSGYALGAGFLFKQNALNRKKVSAWYTNLETMKCKRFADGDTIPDGFVKGRKNIAKDENGRFDKSK